jgi:hypothetical protein
MSAKTAAASTPSGPWKDRSEWLIKAQEHNQQGEAIVKMASHKMRDTCANEMLKFYVSRTSIVVLSFSHC